MSVSGQDDGVLSGLCLSRKITTLIATPNALNPHGAASSVVVSPLNTNSAASVRLDARWAAPLCAGRGRLREIHHAITHARRSEGMKMRAAGSKNRPTLASMMSGSGSGSVSAHSVSPSSVGAITGTQMGRGPLGRPIVLFARC